MSSYEFAAPDLFTTGAVGPPGQRVFYLQARGDGVLVSVKVEKQQVAALAEYLAGILDDLPAIDEARVPADITLVEPAVAEWVVGSLGVMWDEDADRVLLVAEELVDEPEEGEAAASDDEPSGGDELRLRITREQVAAFVAHARELVAAGRPPCPICGRPLDPEGHVCPRNNGHRAAR
jgi:uncharacterized repeat protein (TIGR03847 family)